MRHSELLLRARIRRTIRARWNLNFAWRWPVPRASQTSAENAAVFFGLLALPLSQRPFARWGYPHPRSDAVSISRGAGQGNMRQPQVQCG
jgi:hypothetical protein